MSGTTTFATREKWPWRIGLGLRCGLAALLLAASAAIAGAEGTGADAMPVVGDEGHTNRVRIDYGPTSTPALTELSNMMKERGALERFQGIFSPFRLPIEITLRMKDCGGVSNAWYERPVVTICYEYLADIRKNMPTEAMPASGVFAGITPTDAVFGQFFYVVAHEMGHAVFDLLDVPIFGRAEDAADAFAAYMLLELGKTDARRLILGAAYSYQEYMKLQSVYVKTTVFADPHSAPMQRYYNLLCIGYGAAPDMFGGLVENGYLPKARADNCKMEFYEMNFAFQKSIAPHLDPVLAKQVLDKSWVPQPGSAKPPSGALWQRPH